MAPLAPGLQLSFWLPENSSIFRFGGRVTTLALVTSQIGISGESTRFHLYGKRVNQAHASCGRPELVLVYTFFEDFDATAGDDTLTRISMKNLVLPNKVEIQLVYKNLSPVRLAGVLFEIRLFARFKNDFILGPFASDDSGLVTIVKKDMESEIASNYDFDLMGHSSVENCLPTVEIRLLSEDDIHRATEARRKTWASLSAGERDRWNSIEQLLKMYEDSNNKRLVAEQSSPIRHDWDKAGVQYEYNCVVAEQVVPLSPD